jgi:enediyne biosynthesis protein E4
LPKEAQYSPVYGIASMDANKDGVKDILLGGNNTWTRIRYGRYSANHGVLLTGDGQGGFVYVPQSVSGLHSRGNVRSMQKVKRKGGDDLVVVGLNDTTALGVTWK